MTIIVVVIDISTRDDDTIIVKIMKITHFAMLLVTYFLIIQIDSKVVSKIATGDIDASEAKLLKVWCEKEEIPMVVNSSSYSTVFGTWSWTTAAPVTEMKEVGTEKCKYYFRFIRSGDIKIELLEILMHIVCLLL